MKGQFIIDEKMLANFDNDLGKLTNYMIGKILNNPNHNLGWFARRPHPVVKGQTVYVFDSRFNTKISDKKDILYLLSYQDEGWELAYEIK